jgi:hypothetical protein
MTDPVRPNTDPIDPHPDPDQLKIGDAQVGNHPTIVRTCHALPVENSLALLPLFPI